SNEHRGRCGKDRCGAPTRKSLGRVDCRAEARSVDCRAEARSASPGSTPPTAQPGENREGSDAMPTSRVHEVLRASTGPGAEALDLASPSSDSMKTLALVWAPRCGGFPPAPFPVKPSLHRRAVTTASWEGLLRRFIEAECTALSSMGSDGEYVKA